MAHSTLGHSRVTMRNATARAAYWLGVYAMRRHEWCTIARENKSTGRSYSYAIATARAYNREMVRYGIELRNLNAAF